MMSCRIVRPRKSLVYESARSQMANVNIEDELDDYLKIGGLLYSFISLKDLPDATFPGVLRELVVMDFPIIINAEVVLPDQAKAVKQYKSRLRKMTAAQKDIHGGFRLNVDAQVAEHQLIKVLQELISSSLKSCQLSLTIAVRTSRPARNRFEAEEAERILADRRQRVLHAIARMNGARGIPETLAQKRFFFSSLPGLGEINKRETDVLTLHAADLLPVEMPWKGTPNSPLMLFETPYRQLIPFSPFDSGLGDANMLIMAKSGGGKTFLAQLKLLMMARARPLVSILERGDSYEPLIELMGGRVINVDLDGRETLNPWDLPEGETVPSNEKTAFLKNLTRHMLGESHGSDTSLLDNVLTDAITRVYKRCSIRYSNPIPTFNDLREELANWRDAEKMQRTIDEAHLAAIKLRSWTEGGIYAKLFDRPTTMRLDSDWLFFNVEGLSSDPRLETAMSMLIATAMAARAAGKTGRPSISVLDECWFLLDSPALAPEVVQLYRTARKRNSSVWGISQTVEDFVGTEFQPRIHGPGILKNASTKIIGQQPGDVTPLVNHLNLNPVAVNEVKGFGAPRKGRSAEALMVIGEKAETTQTIRIVPTPLSYWVCTTFPRERRYRAWFLKKHADRPLLESYQDLAKRFPQGLADVAPLPEEISGAVNAVTVSNARNGEHEKRVEASRKESRRSKQERGYAGYRVRSFLCSIWLVGSHGQEPQEVHRGDAHRSDGDDSGGSAATRTGAIRDPERDSGGPQRDQRHDPDRIDVDQHRKNGRKQLAASCRLAAAVDQSSQGASHADDWAIPDFDEQHLSRESQQRHPAQPAGLRGGDPRSSGEQLLQFDHDVWQHLWAYPGRDRRQPDRSCHVRHG